MRFRATHELNPIRGIAANATLSAFLLGSLIFGISGCTVADSSGGSEDSSTAPAVVTPFAITSPTASNYINSSNKSNFTVSVSCPTVGQSIALVVTNSVDASSVSGSAMCTSSGATFTTDLSTLPDGSLTLVASQANSTGGTDTTPSVTLTKFTNLPTVTSVVLSVPSDEWSLSQSPILTWTAASPASGSTIGYYELAVGTTAGGTDILDYKSVGAVLTATISDLILTRGTLYYVSIRAVDNFGNTSTVKNGANAWAVNSLLPATNGTVNAVAKLGSTLYIGGSFTRVGEWTGGGVPMKLSDSTVNWPNINNKSKVAGLVRSSVADGAGGIYIGGTFSRVGATIRNNVAHILADGSVDPNFDPNVTGTNSCVTALALNGTDLYIGGTFTSVGGLPQNNFGVISATTGALVVTGTDLNANDAVNSFAISGTTLYIGGQFTTIGSTNRTYLASISLVDYNLTSFNPIISGAGGIGTIMSLAISGTTLFLGGSFNTVSGSTRNNAAAILLPNGSNGANGTLTSFNPNVGGPVFGVAVSATKAYLTGLFFTVGGSNFRTWFASVSASTGAVDSFNPAPNLPAFTMTLSGSTLYIGGGFTTISGTSRDRVAAYDTSTATPTLLASFAPAIGASTAWTLTPMGSNIYIGGDFGLAGGTIRNYLAAISTRDGSLLSTFDPSPTAMVNTLLLVGSKLFVGGNFTTISGTARGSLVAFSTTTGAIDTNFNPNGNLSVSALAASSDGAKLYVGGAFSSMGGQTRNNIAALNTTNGIADTDFNIGAGSNVNSLALSPDNATLYVGGVFTTIGGQSRNRIAALTTATTADGPPGTAIPGFNPGSDAEVKCLAVSGDGTQLYVGGSFTTIAGQTRNNLAVVKTSDGSIDPGSNFIPNPNSNVTSLILSSDGAKLYVGGAFTSIGGGVQSGFAAVSTSAGILDPNFRPVLSGTSGPLSTILSNTYLYLGGSLSSISNSTNGGGGIAPIHPGTGKYLPDP